MAARLPPSLAVLAAGAALLAGCQESGFDESKETARPLKVQHILGDIGGTKVPGQAERPATLSPDALDDALALGVRPVRAAVPDGRVPDYMRQAARGVDVVPTVTELDVAALEAADPDVIIGSEERLRGLYGGLSRVAPTIATDGGGAAWELSVRLHGEALGRTNDAERLLVDWDRRVARTADRLGDGAGDTRVSVVLVTPSGVRAAGLESFPGRVLSDVGLARPASQDGVREYETVSPEQVRSLDADVVLLSVAPGAEPAARRLRASPEWRGLSAVRAGRVVPVDAGTWWSGGGVLAARAALADVERALAR